ncbi:hypothetical protein [Celeribacter litoreus]|uniref:hypothetical protein n=1 Tax=Celeribacter litoreus TaxID=2876714 RepID=UPI001CCD9C0D|nr:hypothetical protein [Celeribacter litoreus]MCA0043772.1 hypothetical protein [Celeribacter litoreus]
MDQLLAALLDWIAHNTDYRTIDLPAPIVLELSPSELTREFYSGVEHLSPDDGVDERLNALYAPEDGPHGTIYILQASEVDDAEYFEEPSDNPLFREILLHELVHHVQFQSGASESWQCLSMGEKEAYALGGTYLKQTFTADPLPNRNFWGAMYARC